MRHACQAELLFYHEAVGDSATLIGGAEEVHPCRGTEGEDFLEFGRGGREGFFIEGSAGEVNQAQMHWAWLGQRKAQNRCLAGGVRIGKEVPMG